MKKKIFLIALILIMLLGTISTVKANTMLTSGVFKFEHDRSTLSRISPKVTIEQFKASIKVEDASKLKVYTDSTCKKEVTSGYVTTDMVLKYNDKKYTTVVVGDTDDDGELTQLDLSKTIKHIVKLTGAELTGTSYEAADITADSKVDQRDLTKYIRYIVLDELDEVEIDNVAPELTLSSKDITSCSFKVEAKATDAGIGMGANPEYTFYIKKASEPDTSYVEKQTGTKDVLELKNLEQQTEYEVKVVTHDNAGNEAVKTIKVTTMKIPDAVNIGALQISDAVWSKGKATIDISTTTNYKIEYQINGISGKWVKASVAGAKVTVNNLNHNDVIYARLTDGTNSGNYITATIVDKVKPDLILTAVAGVSNIEVTAVAQDNETGISTSAQYIFSIKEAGADDSTYVVKQNTTSKTCNFTGLDQEKEYMIKVEIEDIAGNKTQETITEKTHKIPDAKDVGVLNINAPIWSAKKATVTISTTYTDFQIEYQVNGTTGAWTRSGKGVTTVDVKNLLHNDTIYVRLTDGVNAGDYKEVKIQDTVNPTVTLNLNATTSAITASALAQDLESGIADDVTYKFSIKKVSEPDSSYVEIQNTTSNTCSFTALEADENYSIKVEVQDVAGNTAIKEETKTTTAMPSGTMPGSIMFSSPTWTSGKAKITISTTTSYFIEYQVNGIAGKWTKAIAEGADIDVTNLNHSDVIYARLSNGKSAGSYTTVTIVDSIIPKLSLNLTVATRTVQAVATATDEETGISSTATYKFSMKETGEPDSSYTEMQNTTSTNCTIPSLTIGKNYTIKVEVEDLAGNKAIAEKSILIPDDIAPVVTLTVTTKTTNSATVKAAATDVGGLPTPTIYKFYIKETGAADSTYIEKQVSDKDTCSFTGLQQGKDYTVKVTVEDEAKNVGVKEVSLTTDTIPDATSAGAITFSSITWNLGSAEVEVKTGTSYYIEYQVNSASGTWTRGTLAGASVTVTGLKHNDIIYARLTDGTNTSRPATLTVVDSIKPNLKLTLSADTSKIEAVADGADSESGLAADAVYKFYIKDSTGSYTLKQATTAKTCTFDGLMQNKNYTVKVEVEDLAGNVAVKEQTVLTKVLPSATSAGAINFGSVTWTSGKAKIEISTTTNFYIEYQVNGTSGKWTRGAKKGVSIDATNLSHNDIVYARLTDGTNTSDSATATIVDTVKPTVSMTLTSTTNKITATVTAQDKESGIADVYTFYISDGTGFVQKQKSANKTCEFTGLTQNKNYTIKVEVQDVAGNVSSKEQTTLTKTIPSASTAISFSTPTWESGKAKVEISTEASYQIEYQINGTTGTWTKVPVGTTSVEVTGLSHNDKVYARLTDGVSSGKETYAEIKDTVAPADFTITVSDITYEGLKIAGSTVDNESGLKDYTYVVEDETGKRVIEAKAQTVTSYEVTTGLEEETNYTVYMIAYDNVGNSKVSTKEKIKTEKYPVSEMFGEYIDYPIDLNEDGDTTNDWMIFYQADGNAEGEEEGGAYEDNIGDYYIIVADYFKNTDSRLKLDKMGKIAKNGEYSIYWENYSDLPKTVQKTGTESLTGTGRTINQLFMQNKFGELNNNNNSKAISTFLNIENWDGYVIENLADYAIGAPTVEMWAASWNAVYGGQLKVYTNKKETRYCISTSNGKELNSISNWKQDKLYFPENPSTGRTNGYWLASPSIANNDSLLAINSNIGKHRNNCSVNINYYSFLRPVVHLKSGTELEKVDGVWRIK